MYCFKKVFSVFLLLFFMLVSCINNKKYISATGYDFTKPEKFVMDDALHEISGISFLKANDDTLFAVDDEDGKLFSYSLSSKKLSHIKFSKKGDYEDVTILNNKTFAVLKSDGSVVMFGAEKIGSEKIDSIEQFNQILPDGEYEGLFADSTTLFALCKNCAVDKGKKQVSVYTLQKGLSNPLTVSGTLAIDVSMLAIATDKGKIKFHPSCLAKHPLTHQWYIVSSVNKLLLVLDEQWKVKEYYSLNPTIFKQPEGIAFNSKGDMYISNEGGDGQANILLFKYK